MPVLNVERGIDHGLNEEGTHNKHHIPDNPDRGTETPSGHVTEVCRDDAVFKLNKSYANRWQFPSLALWKSKLESSRRNFLCQAKEASHFLSAVVHKESSGINKFCILRCRIPGRWSPQSVCSNCSIVMGNCPLMTACLPPPTFGFIL